MGLELYFNAFFDLDTDRNHGMGLMRIPWSSMNRYADVHGFDDDQKELLFFYVKRMDAAHLERLDAKLPK